MRIGPVVVALVVAALAPVAGCGKSDKSARKLRKMDVHATIDDRGRLKIALRLFDTKHEQMPVTGAFTGEVAKLDGTVICKATGELAPSDFSEKGVYKAPWHDAQCPPDPGVDELRITVRVTPKGAGGDQGKDDQKDATDAKAKDGSLERVITVPVKSVYERMPVKKPAEPAAAGSAEAAGSAAAGSAAGSAAATPAEKPAEKAEEKPGEKKPGESKAPPAQKSNEKVPLKKWRTGTTDGSAS